MTHYKRDTTAQLEREIEYGQLNQLDIGDTLETFGFSVMNDGGGATYKVMPPQEVVDYGDIRLNTDHRLDSNNVAVLQPYKQPKNKRSIGGRP